MTHCETRKTLLRELDTVRGALRLACTIIRKQKRGQSVDVNAALSLFGRVMTEARETAKTIKQKPHSV